ncbi:type II toxin-antitoxin system HicA family toxin [Candidatus Bathyarchaeota archaeon]|nr:type II toxin-antitoxin system HicA family toxin [Candidatus Bathyarchaeota archaeon]
MSLPVLSGRRVVKALQRAGFTVVGRKGSHIRMRKVSDRVYVAIIPDHREIAPGTLRSILRQAGLTREEFLSLLEK